MIRFSLYVVRFMCSWFPLACFTTCWARLRLYEPLKLLVIYLEEPGQRNPPLGDCLGQFTSELKADDHITEFVSA